MDHCPVRASGRRNDAADAGSLVGAAMVKQPGPCHTDQARVRAFYQTTAIVPSCGSDEVQAKPAAGRRMSAPQRH